MKDIIIAPSILTADFANLGQTLQGLEQGGADWLHLDVMDGHFVPPISFGAPVLKSLRPVTKLFYDVHLMVARPEDQVEQFAAAGADLISFHIEATKQPRRVIEQIRALGPKVGLAMNPATPISKVRGLLDEIDMVVIMTVNPGWGGQKLMTEQLEKARALREIIGAGISGYNKGDRTMIQLDGGVNLSNVKKCVAAGADVLVAGSCIIDGGRDYDYTEIISQLRDE